MLAARPLDHDRLRGLFAGAPVVFEEMALGGDIPALLPEEAAQVARAVGARRREFAAGRHLARRALARLTGAGSPLLVLLNGPDRAPRWPAGIVGSITHTRGGPEADGDGYCAVVLGRDTDVRTVAIDAEEAEDLEPELCRFVLTAGERAALAAEPAQRRGLLAKILFSAKECFYKAQYPVTGRFLGFQEVEVTLDQARLQFRARLVESAREMSECLGRYRMDGGLVLTGIAVPGAGAQW
jgi:4'-phosphopantetheinyl transferase EntD